MNDRNVEDCFAWEPMFCQGVKRSIDGYPALDYLGICIAGGEVMDFKATALEIFRVNAQTL